MIGLAFRLIIYTFAAVAFLLSLSVPFIVCACVAAVGLSVFFAPRLIAWIKATKATRAKTPATLKAIPDIARNYISGKAEETAPEVVEEMEQGFSDLLRGRTVSKAIADEERKLLVLYRRKDKLEAINGGDPAAWDKYQKTKTWRGLLWDIEDTESTLKRLEALN